jgi:hypothetical protein
MIHVLKKSVQLCDLKVRSQFKEKIVREVLQSCGGIPRFCLYSVVDIFKIEYPCMVIDCSELQLQIFFQKHLEFAKNDFYMAGESYVGHYILAFAS